MSFLGAIFSYKASKLIVRIEFGNDAMQTPRHAARALKQAAEKIAQLDSLKADSGKLRDVNGNTIGEWELL